MKLNSGIITAKLLKSKKFYHLRDTLKRGTPISS